MGHIMSSVTSLTLPYFPTLFQKTLRFSEKVIEHKMCELIFSKPLPETLLILRRIQPDTEWRTKCHTIDCTHNTFLFLQKHLISGTELILIGWNIVIVCKKPTLYQSVHEKFSESLLHSSFLHKTIQLSSLDLQSTARCPPFYKQVTSIAFFMNYSIYSRACNIDTMMLQF